MGDLTLLALGIAGLADTFTVVVRSIIVQEATPDEFRGRVNAADFLVGAGGSQLGSLEAGLVGSWTTPVISALSGGLATVAGPAAIGALQPAFRRYRSLVPAGSSGQARATADAALNDRVSAVSTGAKPGDAWRATRRESLSPPDDQVIGALQATILETLH